MSPALLPIDDALAIVLAQVIPLAVESVALEAAYGRFLGEDLVAGLDLPPFANSSMDGYAVRAGDTPGVLRVVGESAAGAPYAGSELGAGQAVAISTGAVLPGGADAIAPVEDVIVADGSVDVRTAVAAGAFVRREGSDVVSGQHLLSAGTRIGPAQIGAAASCGWREVRCRRQPRVAILTTGTELRPPGTELGPGEIYDSNGPMLRAAMRTAGAAVAVIPAAADTADAHREALTRALEHDVVITSGGVSVGPHDLVRDVERELGVHELFWRIALRPGKPLTFGVRDSTLVFGLPGNPVSTLVCFELFVRPALRALQGARQVAPEFRSGVLGAAVRRNPARDDLIRVRVVDGALQPVAGQESHQIAITAQADGLARIQAGDGELAAGAEVSYLPLHAF
jgi:molybdopterin molybdotransferase